MDSSKEIKKILIQIRLSIQLGIISIKGLRQLLREGLHLLILDSSKEGLLI